MSENIEHIFYLVERSSSDNFIDLVVTSGLDPISDFRYSDFEGMDFSDCNLQGFDFTGCDFRKAAIGNADFSGAVVTDALFPPGHKKPADTPGIPPLRSTLDRLIELATNQSQATERADAIRKIHQFFPGSPIAKRFIRERRSADKSRTVRNLAREISGETTHPSLALFETIVRGRNGDSVSVAVRDMLKKREIDDLEYEYLSFHALLNDIEILHTLDKKGFVERNVKKSFAFMIENLFEKRIDGAFYYFISAAKPDEIFILSEIIAAYPDEINIISESASKDCYDIVSNAASALFDNENSYFYKNYEIVNKIIEDNLPLSIDFCKKFFGRGPVPGIREEAYRNVVLTPRNSYTFENIVTNWVNIYLGKDADGSEYRYHRTAHEVISLILDFHPYGILLKNDNWYPRSNDHSEKEIEIARDFLDFHGIHRRRNSRVSPQDSIN